MADRNQAPEEIEVRFYSGYRGGETPRMLLIAGDEVPIERVLERKRIRSRETGSGCDLFRCRAGGRIWIIRRHGDGRVTAAPENRGRDPDQRRCQ